MGAPHFAGGTARPVYEDDRGQYVLDDDGGRGYGQWLPPADGRRESVLLP